MNFQENSSNRSRDKDEYSHGSSLKVPLTPYPANVKNMLANGRWDLIRRLKG